MRIVITIVLLFILFSFFGAEIGRFLSRVWEVLAILIGLSLIGINLSALAVVIGALGIGIGFGLQNVVANYVAGLVILFEQPIKEGDRILVNGLEGDGMQINLRSTVINTLTNETIILPNGQPVGNSIHNYSYHDRRIVIVNKVQVSYSTDLDRVWRAFRAAGIVIPFPQVDLHVKEPVIHRAPTEK